MKKKFIFENVTLNGFGKFDPSDNDIWPSDPKMNRVPLLPWMYVWTKFEDGQGILEVVIGNVFDTFDPGNLDL